MNNKISFLEKVVPFLEDIYNTDEKREWCHRYSVYSSNAKDIWNLQDQLNEFINKSYENGFVPSDYTKMYDEIRIENVYAEKIDKSKLTKLSDDQIVAIIAKQFRNDHFCEGILINKYIADGLVLYYMKELYHRLNTKEERMEITLNDLLHFNESEMDHVKIRFNQSNPDVNPMDLYLKDPEQVNTQWFLWRTSKRYFSEGQIAVCLLKVGDDKWLLTTIKRIKKDLNVLHGINYEAEELPEYKKYYGRVILKFHKTFQSQGINYKNKYQELIVNQILPTTFDGFDFPGYDKVKLTFGELENIISIYKKDWVAALENQKAVYLITDTSNGKLYVGSATGDNGMLLQRWKNYISNGHGGNKELKKLVEDKGFDYVKQNFQYSILENYNAKVDDREILERESWWKEILQTRKFGYNSN